jgi:tripartite-type tricarboxylate transporter receptor subunit TctC
MANYRSLQIMMLGVALITRACLASAFAQEPFYKGKTVRIIVGGSAGGGYDTYTRAIARHLGKHIPGNPTFVVENMTGAGSIIAANYVYKVAKPDGLTLCHFIGGIILQQVLGKPGIEFDARKFLYLGVPAQDTTAVGVTKASGVSSMEQWLSTKTPVKFGGHWTRHCHRRSPQDTASDSRFAHPTRDRLQGHRGYSAGGQQR